MRKRRVIVIKKSIRRIAFIMAICTVVSALASCKPKKGPGNDDDNKNGDDEMDKDYYLRIEKKEPQMDILFDYTDPGFRKANGGIVDNTDTSKPYINERVVYSSGDLSEDASLCVSGKKNFELKSPKISDWSGYDTLSVAVYSGKATNTTVMLYFSSPNIASTAMDPYVSFTINVDWSGWKVLEFSIADAGGNYSPDLQNIVRFNYATSGWGLTCSDENYLCFGYMYLSKQEYEVISPVSTDDPELYKTVKDQWREFLVGDPNENAVHTAEYNSRVAAISNACKNDWDSFKATYSNGEVGKLWGYDVVFGIRGNEVKIQGIYGKIYDMALGYATVGSEYYHNSELYADIVKGLEYAYNNYYGPCVWEKGTYGNWWEWDIGIPLNLTKILMILEDELGSEAVKKYLAPFDYLNEYPSMTACNRLWIGNCVLASAFLQNDAERILISKDMLLEIFEYVTLGDGFYTDGSFIQHEKLSYTCGYGASLFYELTQIMLILRGSRFAFYEDITENQYAWAFDSFQPVLYGGNLFACTRGREVYRNTSEANGGVVASFIRMTTYAPSKYKDKLEAMIRHYMITSDNNYASNVPLMLVDYAVNLKNNDNVTPRTGYELVKVFGNMDRVAMHGEKYGACVSMSSTRIYKYEAINGENRRGWYQGDGMLYIYTDGYDYNYSYFDFVDPFKLPGTTVSSSDRVEQNVSPILGDSAFVGGVEHGKYGIAFMELGYGENKYFSTDLSARKSYFMFDDEIVAVGSGINYSYSRNTLASESGATLIKNDESGVYTVIENRIWRNSDVLTVNGSALSLASGDTKTETVKNMHFTNMGGYVFFDDTVITYGKAENSGQTQPNKTNTFFEATYSHGSKPSNGSYSFIYLPNATAEETAAYSANKDVTILEVSDKVHVVKENTLGITGYVFYEKGSSNGVTANVPCAVMITDKDGKVEISVSDPTHLLQNISLTVDLGRSLSVKSADDGVSVTSNGNNIVIDVAVAGNVGNTYSLVLG